jgi:carbon storage regulator
LTNLAAIVDWHGTCFSNHGDNAPTLTEAQIMLVLSRKVGEKVVIDGCITVTVVAVDGNKVRLGFTAPHDVRIDREEVHRHRMEFAEIEVNSEELVGV